MSTMKFTSWQDLDGNEVANSAYPPGLVLIKSQTIGTAVSSVTVSDVFSSAFDNYKIILSGGTGTTAQNISMIMGSTTSGYFSSIFRLIYSSNTETNVTQNNEANWYRAGAGAGDGLVINCDLLAPYLASKTIIAGAPHVLPDAAHTAGIFGGWLNNTNQYTSFTINPHSGTFTGGTIRVYGYQQ